jgi:hypothetical protein
VKSKFSGGGAAAGAGNLLAGGVIGAVVDGTNGSMNNLVPNPLQVTLVPVGGAGEASYAPAADAPAPAEAPEGAATAADPQPNPQL